MHRGDGKTEGPTAAADAPDPDGDRSELADRNLVAWLTLLARHAAGGQVHEGDGYVFLGGAHDYPGTYTNAIIRTHAAGERAVSPAELLARAEVFFGTLGRPYVTWVRAHLDDDLGSELRRRGHWPRPPAEGSPLVWLTLGPGVGEDGVAPTGIELSEAGSDDERLAFIDLIARGYGLAGADPELSQALLFSLESLRAPGVHVYLARQADTGRVGGGMVSFDAEGGLHLGWNLTDPELRGRGIGRAVTRLALREARRSGATYACGVASQMGLPVWLGMGFEVPTSYQRYVAPSPPRPPAQTESVRRARRRRPGGVQRP